MKSLPLNDYLTYLKLAYVQENLQNLTDQAAQQKWSLTRYLSVLLEGEVQRRQDNHVQRRIAAARFPVRKTLEDFDWSWPRKINQGQVRELFELRFVSQRANVVFIGNVGLGKTHLAAALGYAACLKGHSVLFTSAVDIINTLAAAQANHQLRKAIKKYLLPRVLVMD